MKNIFVFGADDTNMRLLEEMDCGEPTAFHRLYDFEYAKKDDAIPVKEMLYGGLKKLRSFNGSVDGVVAYWDFPLSTMLPLFRDPFGLAGPSLEAILKCEHKYWSRVEQEKAVPNNIPKYCAVDPFAENPREQIKLDYPFWIKPVKSVSSHLGFKIDSDEDFEHAIEEIRENIERFARPFNFLLDLADVPLDIRSVDGHHCVAESIISEGEQCTLEGYVHNGQTVVYGVIDSVREGKHRSSFARYHYPSELPQAVQNEMKDVAAQFFKQIDFDDGPFNIEFFWNKKTGKIFLLEANTRISKSHSHLFNDVDGQFHQKVMVDLAKGQKPVFPSGEGKRKMAAKFMWRIHHNAVVRNVPDPERMKKIEARFPQAAIYLFAKEGMLLSELKEEQDSYSYEIANIFVGADSEQELLETYENIKQDIGLKFIPLNKEQAWRSSTNFPNRSNASSIHGSP